MYYQQPDGVSVHDGFPNPAADSSLQPLDLNALLIKNPISTYFMQTHGKLLVVDRSLTPRSGDLVIWSLHDELKLSYFNKLPADAVAWGVVTASIRQYSRVKS